MHAMTVYGLLRQTTGLPSAQTLFGAGCSSPCQTINHSGCVLLLPVDLVTWESVDPITARLVISPPDVSDGAAAAGGDEEDAVAADGEGGGSGRRRRRSSVAGEPHSRHPRGTPEGHEAVDDSPAAAGGKRARHQQSEAPGSGGASVPHKSTKVGGGGVPPSLTPWVGSLSRPGGELSAGAVLTRHLLYVCPPSETPIVFSSPQSVTLMSPEHFIHIPRIFLQVSMALGIH